MNTNKGILFISQYFPPDVTAAAFRVSETAEILKDDGFKVNILTAVPHKSEIKDNYIKKDFDVVRVPIFRLGGKKTKDFLIHYISFMLNSFLWGIFKLRSRVNYVIASSPPLMTAFSGWLLARFKKANYILDIRDIWPDSAIATGHLRPGSLLYRATKFFEYFIYNKAGLITCVSDKMKEYIRSRISKDIPIIVLYNGLSMKFLDDNQIRYDNFASSKNEFIISYIGNIGYAQNLDFLIDVATLCKKEDIKFHLIGKGAVKNILMEKVTALGLKNFIFKNGCSKKEAFEYMNRSHVLLIILNKRYSAFYLTIPSKVFDYLWANKPILYGIEGEGRKILDSLPGNIYFDSNDPNSLARAIINLKNNYSFYKSKADRNRAFVLNNFTREKMTKKLEKYLL